MPLQIRCPKCQKALKVRDELAGKKVKCPNCAGIVPVPVPEPVVEPEPEVLEPVEEEAAPVPANKPAKSAITAKPKSEPQPPEEEEDEELEESVANEKPKSKSGKGASKAVKGGKWVPCPKCGAESPKRVMYTMWGSFYGPRIFNHVRCQECRATYNGKTGGSNIIPAIGCVTVPLLGIILILGGLGLFVFNRLVLEPAKLQKQDLDDQIRFKQPILPKGN